MSYMDRGNAERLVNMYSDMILRISFMYLRQKCDAEDICQEVFLKMLMLDLSFASPDHEKAWVIRATVNACKDVLRKKAVRRFISLEAEPVPDRTAETPEVLDLEFIEALQKLPANYRLSLLLFYYEGYKVKEIAEIVGKNENTVSAYLSRGQKRLREILQEDVKTVGTTAGSKTGGAHYVR